MAALADPAYQEQRRDQFKQKHPNMTEEEITKSLQAQESRIYDRLDRRIHSVIQQESGSINGIGEAVTIFQRARQTADAAIRRHEELVFPESENTLLQDDLSAERTPAELLRLYFDTTTDDRTRFELKRQFLLADIAMQERCHYNETAKRKLEQIQTFLREKFYKNPNGDPVTLSLYGVFDNKTNELQIDENGNPQYIYAEPFDNAPAGQHHKKITVNAMELKSGGYIVVLPNIKNPEAAVKKPLRKAMSRDEYPHDDTIEVAKDVQDTHRMKIVVLGGQEATDRFSEKFFDEITDATNWKYFYAFGPHVTDENGIPLGAPTGKGEIQYGAKEGVGKSPNKVNYTKLMLLYAGIKNPVKIVIQPIHSYITEQTGTGVFDPVKGRMDGPAHDMVTIQRELPLAEIFAPRGVYDGLQNQGVGSQTPHPALAAKVEELLTSRELTVAA